jgi:hypothetical protein
LESLKKFQPFPLKKVSGFVPRQYTLDKTWSCQQQKKNLNLKKGLNDG